MTREEQVKEFLHHEAEHERAAERLHRFSPAVIYAGASGCTSLDPHQWAILSELKLECRKCGLQAWLG